MVWFFFGFVFVVGGSVFVEGLCGNVLVFAFHARVFWIFDCCLVFYLVSVDVIIGWNEL